MTRTTTLTNTTTNTTKSTALVAREPFADVIRENTDELLRYFADRREQAARETVRVLRDLALKSEHDSEWHTLFSVLLIPSMRALYDGVRVAERLEAMRRTLLESGRDL